MQVIDKEEKRFCDNCDEYKYAFAIQFENGEHVVTLCKECLLKLLDAIVRR